MHPTKSSVLRSPCFWKMVFVSVSVSLLFYVMTSDMQEYHTMYMNKVTRPTSKHFVCVHIHGTKLEQRLFEFSYGFGLAQTLGSFILMQREEALRNVFKLKPVKFLQSMTVCNSFRRISIPNYGDFTHNMSVLNREKHYDLGTFNTSAFPSILYFDKYKHILMQHLEFTIDIDSKAENYFQLAITEDEKEPMGTWTNVAVYVANIPNNAEVSYDEHADYMRKYLTVAISYYTTRVSNARFIVYAIDVEFVRKILAKQTIHAIFIPDKMIMEKRPEILMRVLSLCDHVITSDAADMFGWWVGYFSKGTVVYPRKSTNDSNDGHINRDIYPHSWIGLVF